MARLESFDIPFGTKMPKFILRDPNGVIQVSDYAFGKKGLLIVFTCNHCPYAKAVWPRIIRLSTLCAEKRRECHWQLILISIRIIQMTHRMRCRKK